MTTRLKKRLVPKLLIKHRQARSAAAVLVTTRDMGRRSKSAIRLQAKIYERSSPTS